MKHSRHYSGLQPMYGPRVGGKGDLTPPGKSQDFSVSSGMKTKLPGPLWRNFQNRTMRTDDHQKREGVISSEPQ